MSSNESSAHRANPQASESVRCFGGHASTGRGGAGPRRRVAGALAYALVAAVTVFGCTRTAAATQGSEASLLVEGYGAGRASERETTPGFLESLATVGAARPGRDGLNLAEAAPR